MSFTGRYFNFLPGREHTKSNHSSTMHECQPLSEQSLSTVFLMAPLQLLPLTYDIMTL